LAIKNKTNIMRKILVIVLAAFICYGFFSCNAANDQKASDEKAQSLTLDKKWATSFIDSINQKFSEQIASGDSAALASHYWPDAELLLDNSEVIKGKDILNAWGAAIRMGIKEVTFSTTDITGSPTYIIETGKYEMKDGSKSLLDRGKYVVVWENRNGEWKLYRDIGSTSMPATK
jgi:ketosteroid isomerase-like protein